MSLPVYVTEAIGRFAGAIYDRTTAERSQARLEAAIERYAHESVAADYRKRWQESYGKLIEDQPDTLPPFIDNPPPIG